MFIYSIPLWVPVLLLPLIILVIRNLQIRKAYRQLPPGPPKLPIIGNLYHLRGSPHRSLNQLSRKYGPVMLLQLGYKPSVIISSAEAAEEVLKTNDIHCCTRPPLTGARKLSYNFQDISFSPYCDYWRQIRKICVVELFSLKRVQSFRFIREEEVASLINSINESSSYSVFVDLTEKLVTLVANITFRMAFSTTLEATDFSKHRFKRLVDNAEALLGSFSANDYFPYVGWIIDRITGYQAKTERIFQEMDTFYQQVIDEHLQNGRIPNKEQEDIVDVLLRIEREQGEVGLIQLTKDHVKAVLMDLFLAGVSTGSDILIWAMSELARNSRVMKKVQEEIRTVIGNKGIVTESEIDELHYLKMIIKETLRLHPPVPLLLPRQAMSKLRVKSYEIYPGMLIQVNVWAIGRDPKCWKNPEEFIPERFQDSSVDFKGQNFEFLPFGAGRRSCPGQYMGTILMEIVLANLLYSFDWKLAEGFGDVNMEEIDGPSLVAVKKEALKLVPVKYQVQPS